MRHTELTKANALLCWRGTPIAQNHCTSLRGGCSLTRVRARFLAFLLQSLRPLRTLCALSVLATSVASAQPDSPSSPELQLQHVPTMHSMEEQQLEYDSIRLWGPALGVPASYFTAGGGMAMIVSANLDFCFYPPCVEEPRTRSERAFIASGSIFIAAGVARFIASIVRIAQKRERKRRLRFEMGQLRLGS